MPPYRPKLRAHLRVDGDHLTDELLERSHPLVATAAALGRLLDGAEPWPAIRARVVDGGHRAEDVDAALRGLLALHAVEGAGDELAARLARVVRREEIVPTSILDGARFGCQGSGACCSGYAFGPLADADVARLAALDLAAAFPGLAAPYVETTERGHFLRKIDDHCVFLADDRRCGLHAAFGADAKPGLCRLYPMSSFGTVTGIRVVDRGTCATFGVSVRAGLPLVDDLARLRPLLDPPLLHHPVAFVDGWPCDFGLFLGFTSAATALVRRQLGPASATLTAIGRSLDALAAAVGSCPLEPGQPDGAVAAVLAADAAAWYQPVAPAAAAAGVRALAALVGDLAAALTASLDHGGPGTGLALLRELVGLLAHTRARLDRDDDGAGPPAHAAEVDEVLRLSLRQQLFGREVLVGGSAGAGLVRIAMIQLLALAGARAQAGARPLAAADLSRGHMLATRGFNLGLLDPVLVGHGARWRELLVGLDRAAALVTATRES